MKRQNLFLFAALLFSLSFFMTSCSKDDPEPENEEEVITTMTYTLTPSSGSAVVLSFKDLDGDGGNDPVVTGGTLAANTTYTGTIKLLNEQESPAENVTEEIEEEDKDHQFFFNASGANITVAYEDKDGDGNPVGLSTKLTTGAASNGTLKVTLRHEPNKSESGVKDGDISNAGGETDIEVTFDVEIK